MNLDTVTVEDLERDPYPVYAYLRDNEPIAYMPCLDVWMVTRWDDVSAALVDPTTFPAAVENSPTDTALGGVSMMTTDGEPAKRRRRPFDPTFRPRAVEASMPGVFARICDEQLDLIEKNGPTDLVSDYFEPISLQSLAHAMGIADLVDVVTLRRWFNGLAAGVSNYEEDPAKTRACEAVSEEIDELLIPRFAEKLRNPDDSMMSDLVNAFEGPLEDRLAWTMPSLKLVLLGGLQEPAHGGATIAACLLSHPDQLAAVRGDPGLVSAAVEEGLRWTAPIGNLLRGVAPGTVFGGVEFSKDARIILIVSSANRDRSIWGPTADDFDIHRPKRSHLSFAAGPHYCIGHHFARAQLRVAVDKLISRFPGLSLDPDREVVFKGHEYRSPLAVEVLTG
jgi:cytochrome P450